MNGELKFIISIGQETLRDEPLGDLVVDGRLVEFSSGCQRNIL
jgi:hypothetical protein